MANKTLKKQVIEQLTSKMRRQYEQDGFSLNTDTKTIKNYNQLCQALDKIRKTNFKNASVSTNQLMKLFTVPEQEAEGRFKLDFLDLCFWYAYEMTCDAYLETQPIENQVIQQNFIKHKFIQAIKNREEVSLESVLEEKEHEIHQLNEVLNQQKTDWEAILKQNEVLNFDLNQQKADLEGHLKQNEVLNFDLNQQKIDFDFKAKQNELQIGILKKQKQSFFQKVLYFGVVVALTAGVYGWHWQAQRYEELIWLNGYNLKEVDESIYLKAKLPFITDSTSLFRKNVRNWVKLLLQGYQKWEHLPATTFNPHLIHYADLSDSLQTAYTIDSNKYYIDVAAWRDPNQDDISPTNTLVDSVNTLFGGYVNQLMSQKTKWLHAKTTDDFFFESFFGVPQSARYKPIFMFTVFKSDASSFNASQEIMVRYPPYDTKNVDAAGKTYHLQTRPWWRDAGDSHRTQSFCWQETIEGQLVTMGLSRAYSSIRVDHRMQQRAFWVAIPVRKPNKFFLCIDLILKID